MKEINNQEITGKNFDSFSHKLLFSPGGEKFGKKNFKSVKETLF